MIAVVVIERLALKEDQQVPLARSDLQPLQRASADRQAVDFLVAEAHGLTAAAELEDLQAAQLVSVEAIHPGIDKT
jgi:hypothetical protein